MSRILAESWKHKAICAACRDQKSASLLTGSIVFGVASGEPVFCARTPFFTVRHKALFEHRFALCGDFSDILVARNAPQHRERTWEVTPADIRWTDALYPVAQQAMQRGYYMPNRNSTHCSRHQCPHWRRCEQDFGGVVEA